MNVSVRKDVDGCTTVSKLKSILKDLSIDVVVTEEINPNAPWASVRLEMSNITSLGTNGKGINLEYATASAYAEFLERLSSGYLVNNLYPRVVGEETIEIDSDTDCFLDESPILNQYPEYMISNDQLNLLNENPQYRWVEEYYEVFSKEVKKLPQWFINMNCGSNGLCAGNSAEEAILQGINEVQERYARTLFFNDMLNVRTIPDQDLLHLTSWKMIEEVRKMGYICQVKDFTNDGQIPVLGVLIADSTLNYYIVSLGAEYDIDICLQRCVTELFQGRELNLWFKLHLNSTFECSSFFVNSESPESERCYQRNVLCNKGNYSLRIFDSRECDGNYKKAFLDNYMSTKDTLKHALSVLQKTNKKVYIHDYSKYDFPVYRVYIPGMSEISNLSMQMLSVSDHIDNFLHLYHNPEEVTIENVRKFSDAVEALQKLPFYKVENISMAISKLPELPDDDCIGFNDVNVLVALFNYYVGNYQLAYENYRKYTDSKNNPNVPLLQSERGILLCFKCLQSGLEWDEIFPILRSFGCEDIGKWLQNPELFFNSLPKCPNCDLCKISNCAQEEIRNIRNRLRCYQNIEQGRLKFIFEKL